MADEEDEAMARLRSDLTDKFIQPRENLTLVMLREIRAELKVVRENQVRDRELITRLASATERGLDDVRRDMREMRSDVVSMEMKLLTVQNEILDAQRRLTEALLEADAEDGEGAA